MESRVTVYIGDVVDNLPPPSGYVPFFNQKECDRVEEKEQKETKGHLNLKVDSQEAAGKSLVPSEVEVTRGC